jgi:hypothetical protein
MFIYYKLNNDDHHVGEPIVEPEVDLSSFLARQRHSDEQGPSLGSETTGQPDDEGDIDHTLAHITSNPGQKRPQAMSKKGKVEELEWDENLESMAREKAAAEATWGSSHVCPTPKIRTLLNVILILDLKDRFRAKSEKLKSRPIPGAKERKGMI